ncbi:hypothetical protein BD289DRAFT_435811 [Coniella lustricola]|uniref:Secreted protein n=1 Tax=Coniella lustricola TaxID=2025994 RepID=A0A2T3A5X9_9PEZI|nr:hypothetical protein BD289DRAFT_435811 [Coniella lustricola]
MAGLRSSFLGVKFAVSFTLFVTGQLAPMRYVYEQQQAEWAWTVIMRRRGCSVFLSFETETPNAQPYRGLLGVLKLAL